MFSSLSLRLKLWLSFGFVSLCLLFLGITFIVTVEKVGVIYSHVAVDNLGNVAALLEASGAQKDVIIAMAALTGFETTKEEYEATKKKFDDAVIEYETQAKAYEAIPFVAGEEALWEKVKVRWTPLRDDAIKLLDLSSRGSKEDFAARDKYFKEVFMAKRMEFRKAMRELITFQMNESKQWTADAHATSLFASRMAEFSTAIAMIISLILGFVISSSLSKNLKSIATNLFESANRTTSSSEHLLQASQQVAAASSESAASLEETVASLEEISGMVKLSAGNAEEASRISGSSWEAARAGEKEIQGLITAMSEMAAGSKKIEDIITVIDDIAFQTNLLALNAAVEAARAGEQGKGFAVVAEAVRTLALRSADAAKDINSLIKQNVEKAEQGTSAAARSNEVLQDIVNSVKKVADLNNEIASGSAEQSKGISQISIAMNQLDQVTQTNAASSTEVASSSEDMSEQAQQLHRLVSQLASIVDGRSSRAATHDAPSSNDHSSGHGYQSQSFKRAA